MFTDISGVITSTYGRLCQVSDAAEVINYSVIQIRRCKRIIEPARDGSAHTHTLSRSLLVRTYLAK